jgi:hypothetical protein
MGGEVKRVLNSYVYDKYEDIFQEFVKKFTSIREKGGYYKIFGKLMINSLYGSMALNSEEEIFYISFDEIEFYNILKEMNVVNFYKINDSFIIIIKKDYKSKKFFRKKFFNEKKSNRNVSYAAAISSKARIKLYGAMLEVIADGGRLLYCDTDSIFAAYAKDDMRSKAKKII